MITREKVLQQIKASDVYDDNLKPIEGTVEGYWWLKCYSPNPKIFTRRLFKCGINSYPSARLDEDLAYAYVGERELHCAEIKYNDNRERQGGHAVVEQATSLEDVINYITMV